MLSFVNPKPRDLGCCSRTVVVINIIVQNVGRVSLDRWICVTQIQKKFFTKQALGTHCVQFQRKSVFVGHRCQINYSSSSVEINAEINTAIFNHCVVHGHISHITKICDQVLNGFKAAVMSSESDFINRILRFRAPFPHSFVQAHQANARPCSLADPHEIIFFLNLRADSHTDSQFTA